MTASAGGVEARIALVIGPTAATAWDAPTRPRAALVGSGAHADVRVVADLPDVLRAAAELEEARRPRWVWWGATGAARALVGAGTRPSRVWDLAEAHRLWEGGDAADPGLVWAAAHGLPLGTIPAPPGDDILDALALDAAGATDPERATLDPAPGSPAPNAPTPTTPGHLRPEAAAGTWQVTDARLARWAELALECAAAQEARIAALSATSPALAARLLASVHSESAAAVLCEELFVDGLPVDRRALLEVIEPLATDPGERDAAVLALVPGHEHIDLRHPAQVREMLASVGLDVPSTRKHVLELFRDAHPVVPALLEWRKAERIATTYGLRWMEQHIGSDDRLRGRWRASDGAAGRMTAEAGLHNLPAILRPGVAAADGYALVRSDLGQIEPRVLAVVSGDRAFAAATAADDLYAPVAQRLGVERPVAKVAVLAAMYGQRSGAAGRALEGLERAYPTAMRLLDAAYEAGVRGEPVRTWGGRTIRTAHGEPGATDRTRDAAYGRFARNAVIQGAAAELFKAWAATVRAAVRPLGASIVLCLHDELLVHAPAAHAAEVAGLVDACLEDAARRWTGGAPVRFVAETSIVHRWSEAKD